MKQEMTYTFTYKLGNGIIGEVKIKADSFYSACDKFDDWKVEKGLDTDKDNEIIDLSYRVSGLTDSYSKEQCNVNKNRYIIIDMETLKIDLVKKDLSKELVPFDIADTIITQDEKEMVNMLWNIIGDYEKNKRKEK